MTVETINALNILEPEALIDVDPLNENFKFLDDKMGTLSSTLNAYLESQLQSINNKLASLYPVGSIYIGTMSTCPLAALFGTWELKSQGRVLQGADNDHEVGTTIAAGLPNIAGGFGGGYGGEYGYFWSSAQYGAFGNAGGGTRAEYPDVGAGEWDRQAYINFSAKNSNSIYDNSTTVQPPAYVVNIWERVA